MKSIDDDKQAIKDFLEHGLDETYAQLKALETMRDGWNDRTRAEMIYGIKGAVEKAQGRARELAGKLIG